MHTQKWRLGPSIFMLGLFANAAAYASYSSLQLTQSLQNIPQIFETHNISHIIDPEFFTKVCKDLILCHKALKIHNRIAPTTETQKALDETKILIDTTAQTVLLAKTTYRSQNEATQNQQTNELIAQLIETIAAANSVHEQNQHILPGAASLTKIENEIPFFLKSAGFAFITIALCYVSAELMRWYLGEELLLMKIQAVKDLSEKLLRNTKAVHDSVDNMTEEYRKLNANVQQAEKKVKKIGEETKDKRQLIENDQKLAEMDRLLAKGHEKNKKEITALKTQFKAFKELMIAQGETNDSFHIMLYKAIQNNPDKAKEMIQEKLGDKLKPKGMTRSRSRSEALTLQEIEAQKKEGAKTNKAAQKASKKEKKKHKRTKSGGMKRSTGILENLSELAVEDAVDLGMNALGNSLNYKPPTKVRTRRRSHTTAPPYILQQEDA